MQQCFGLCFRRMMPFHVSVRVWRTHRCWFRRGLPVAEPRILGEFEGKMPQTRSPCHTRQSPIVKYNTKEVAVRGFSAFKGTSHANVVRET